MRAAFRHPAIALLVLPGLAACGGPGAGNGIVSTPAPVPAPAPAPSPAPSPTPAAAFQPIPAQIFATDPLVGTALTAMAEGWAAEHQANGPLTNIHATSGVSVSYDPATDTYAVNVPGVGSGTLMQVSPVENGGFRSTVAGQSTTGETPKLIDWAPPTASQYSYVALGNWWGEGLGADNTWTTDIGVLAVAQRTPEGGVPVEGSARFLGDVVATLEGYWGDTVGGRAEFDFDFLTATLTGHADLKLMCMMGCSYDPTTYTFTNTSFARGATSFSGSLTASNVSGEGQFAGVFAGPAAEELAASFHAPYFDPDDTRTTTVSGIIAAKKN